MELAIEQKDWAKRKKQDVPPRVLKEMIEKQQGCCALSGIEMHFNKKKYGTPGKGKGAGCHPLYAAIDHVNPHTKTEHQLVCYDLNDLKGHLPVPLFEALTKTKEWKEFIKKWKELVDKGATIEEYKELIRRGR